MHPGSMQSEWKWFITRKLWYEDEQWASNILIQWEEKKVGRGSVTNKRIRPVVGPKENRLSP